MSVTTQPAARSADPATGETIAQYARSSDTELGAFGIREFVNVQAVTVAPRR